MVDITKLGQAGMVFVLAALILAIGAIVMTEVQTSDAILVYDHPFNETNITFAVNGTWRTLCNFTMDTANFVVSVDNTTRILDSTEYGLNASFCQFELRNSTVESVDAHLFSNYTHFGAINETAAYNATTAGVTALGGFADWLPLLAITVVAGLIVAILLANFGGLMQGKI